MLPQNRGWLSAAFLIASAHALHVVHETPPPAQKLASARSTNSAPERHHSEAHKLKKIHTNRSLHVSKWFGRAGNNLIQLANALMMAEETGRDRIVLPDEGSYLTDLFDMPEVMAIESNATFRGKMKCTRQYEGLFWGKICENDGRDIARVLRKYMLPLRNEATVAACEKEASKKETEELVIHLRSGDLLESSHFEAMFAPCSFFDHVIAEHDFQRVRIVTEPDMLHPCIEQLKSTHNVGADQKVVVESRSMPEDACTLMNARYLALGSTSTFATLFGNRLNERLMGLYTPFTRGMDKLGRECPSISNDGCEGGKVFIYCVPGLNILREGADKTKFIRTYPDEKIYLNRCKPDRDVI